MKNLVILHLESVSQQIFKLNSEFFKNINIAREKSLQFSHYYATATSTAMVINDITYGDFYRTENTELFGEFKRTHTHSTSFVDELEELGYKTLGVHYPAALGNEINPGHMYAERTDLVNYSDYATAISDVKKTIKTAEETKSPFLIYFCNEVSHLCYNDGVKFRYSDPTERWKYGYETIDKSVGDIITLLKDNNLMDSTTIVLYGDHGDDFYTHGYNGGYAHSIEPYENIVHTPFMIIDSDLEPGVCEDIICSLDVKTIVYNLIGCMNDTGNAYIRDIYHSDRKYVFSRNLFAAQQPQKINGYICNVHKSYGIIDPLFTMIASNGGLRLYINKLDPTCNNNVLDYFYLHDGKLLHMGELDYLFAHYKSFMGYGSIRTIQKAYRRMRANLNKELAVLKAETKLEEILAKKATDKICYTKNMPYEFGKIKVQRIKKGITNKSKK